MPNRTSTRILVAALAAISMWTPEAGAQQVLDGANTPPFFGSIATPRPINPAAGTTNPSARATQSLNPYLGSIPDGQPVRGEIQLSLEDAIARGLKFNLGIVESGQANAITTALRRRALAELLPQITARAQQTYQDLSFRALGLKLPPQAGFQIPATSGGFGYSEASVAAMAPVLNMALVQNHRALKAQETAAMLSAKDARDVVVAAVGSAYFQVVASEARVSSAEASLRSIHGFEEQVADQYKAELSPEIEMLRAEVELSTAEQRVTNAKDDLEKDKLTLARLTGISLAQAWRASRPYGYTPLPDLTAQGARALETRSDVASTKQLIASAEFRVKAARAARLPVVSFEATYGSGGLNPGNYNQVYSVTGGVSVPLFTGGRIRSDVDEAEAVLDQRRAEARDLEGRVDYDVRVAQLDARASDSAMKVAARNQDLAKQALAQSQDRFRNGVTNYLEVLQAQEAVVAADENYIATLFSFNVAKISLARALGSAETRLADLFGSH